MNFTLSQQPLFTPVRTAKLELPNRIVMAPLTRMRAANPGHVPTELHAEYYAQRASAGLIIGECTEISPDAYGWLETRQRMPWKRDSTATSTILGGYSRRRTSESCGRALADGWIVSQTRAVRSPEAEARRVPSRLKATA
jgi:hypothetical protein